MRFFRYLKGLLHEILKVFLKELKGTVAWGIGGIEKDCSMRFFRYLKGLLHEILKVFFEKYLKGL